MIRTRVADCLRAFFVQLPPTIIAIVLVQWRLNTSPKYDNSELSRWDKVRRIDFIGAFFLCFTILAFCFVIDMGGAEMAWSSPLLISFAVGGAVSGVAFVISARKVKEPIFPLRLFAHYDVITNYLSILLQIMVQMSLMVSVPLYFQATKNASTAEAGAYLVPAFAGNTLGGLLAGYWIRKTGLYKTPTVLAPFLSIFCMLLCLLTWNGDTSIGESLYTFIGGFATGLVSSSAFVGLAAAVPEEDIAIAGSGMYLFFNIGAIAGASTGGAVYQAALRAGLENALKGVKHGHKVSNGMSLLRSFTYAVCQIVQKLLEKVQYVQTLDEELRRLVIPAYVQSFHHVNSSSRSKAAVHTFPADTIIVLGLSCAAVSLVIAVFSRGKRLTKSEGS